MAVHWKLFLVSLFKCLIGFSGFYHMASLNVLEPYIKRLINDSLSHNYNLEPSQDDITWAWSSMAASWLVGFTLGSLLIESLAERFGRRFTVNIFKNLILIVGSLMQYFSKRACSFELLLLGRIISGVSGPFSHYACVYMAERAPSKNRGTVSTLTSLGYRLWIIIGIFFGLPHILGTEEQWPLVLLLPVVPALLEIMITPLHPDSPKHLFITENKVEKAKKAIRFYHGPLANVQAVLQEYLMERELQCEQKGLKAIWATRHLKWPVIVVVVACSAVSLIGTDVVSQYSAEMLNQGSSASSGAFETVLYIQLPSLMFMIVALGLMSFWGRRSMFLSGLGLAIVGNTCISLTGFEILNSDYLLLAGLSILVIGDALGPASISLFLAGELCPQVCRSLAVTIAFFLEAFLSTTIALVYPPLQLAIGNFAMAFLTVSSIGCFVFLYFNLPETRNKTVDEAVSRWMEVPCEETPLVDCLAAVSYDKI